MPIAELSYRIEFCAAHRLHNPDMTHEENARVFGKCANANGHGHNYILEMVLRGEIDKKTGMILNVFDIEKIVEDKIMTRIDHKHLNLDVPEFKTLIPTAENIAVVVWGWLKAEFNELLHEIRIHETSDCVVSYFGE